MIPVATDTAIYHNYTLQTHDPTLPYELDEPGLYCFKDEKGEATYILYYEHDEFLFDELPVKIKGDKYLYNHPLEGYFISKTKQEDMVLVEENQEYYLYQVELKKDGSYQSIVIDQTPPQVYLKVKDQVIQGNILHTNKDFDMVIKDSHLENNEQIYVESYQLEDGVHHLPYHVKDELGNETQGTFEVTVDKTNPTTTLPSTDVLYLNQPLRFELKDNHLDLKKCLVMLQDKSLPLDALVLNQSGELNLHLEDTFGNSSDRTVHINYDDVRPHYDLKIEGTQMIFVPSERLASHQLKLNHQPLKNFKQRLEEGWYHLEGVIEDPCGNKTQVDESFCIDVTPPRVIYPALTDSFYTNDMLYEVTFEDRFLKLYQLVIYRNDERIHTYQGNQSDHVSLRLDDPSGRSYYRIEGMVDDGTYQNSFSHSFVIDRYLQPVTYLINQTDGKKVKELTLLVDTQFQTMCPEGMVTYQLYDHEELLTTAKGESFLVYAHQHPTHLKIEVVDEAMHKEEKIIYFNYPQPLEEQKEEAPLVVLEHKETPPPPTSALEEPSPVMKPTPQTTIVKQKVYDWNVILWMSMGGIGCVMLVYLFRRQIVPYDHQTGETNPVSDTGTNDTVLCDKDTTLYLDDTITTKTTHND